MLYALSLEPLLEKIRSSFQGLFLPGFNSRLSAYADDVIVFIKDEQDVCVLNSVIEKFSVVSAASVNWKKSEALAVGPRCWPSLLALAVGPCCWPSLLASGGRASLFVGSSTVRLLCDMGCMGARCRKAIKDLTEEAERSSFWLWLRRKHSRGWVDNT